MYDIYFIDHQTLYAGDLTLIKQHQLVLSCHAIFICIYDMSVFQH